MGLMTARVGHTLASPKVAMPATALAVGGGVTALTVGAQWGWGADLSKHETPNGWLLTAGTIASGVGGIVGVCAWGDRNAAIAARGRLGFAAAVGTLGAMWIGVPVARRALAAE